MKIPHKSKARRLRELADRVDRITQSDRRFFERHPDRRHRVRLAGQAEREQLALLGDGRKLEIPPGCRLYVAVHGLAPGARSRVFLVAPEGRETDVSEITARVIFQAAAWVCEVEAATLQAVGQQDRSA